MNMKKQKQKILSEELLYSILTSYCIWGVLVGIGIVMAVFDDYISLTAVLWFATISAFLFLVAIIYCFIDAYVQGKKELDEEKD